jgi:hypothetical protein
MLPLPNPYTVRKTMLSINADSKTIKGNKYGYLTGILYLAPHTIAGANVCANAEIAGCIDSCLYQQGRARVFSSIQTARINKTKLFHANRDKFMLDLVKSIGALIRKADREKQIPVVRLNGTSDIRWEKVFFPYEGRRVTIFDVFPDLQFYDYTKLSNRKDIPQNYDLTFSYSSRQAYQAHVKKAIAAGMRVAVVFADRQTIPSHFLGLPVIDGDNSDLRFIEAQACIVGLYAKGTAKKDYSGFVVHFPSIPVLKAA